jgi:hypothetical protein
MRGQGREYDQKQNRKGAEACVHLVLSCFAVDGLSVPWYFGRESKVDSTDLRERYLDLC